MGINFQKVDFKYSPLAKHALQDINLEINGQDELIFVVGKTGSGKSTLVQSMNALLLPTQGNITIFDYNIVKKFRKAIKFNTKKNQIKYDTNSKGLFLKAKLPIYNKLKHIRKDIGLVFQFPEYQLFESSVIKDVMFGPINFGYDYDKAKKLASEALEMVGIGRDLYNTSPFELSGGQMRRVSIAAILACDPKIIVFDEPTVGLDPKGKEDLIKLIKDIKNTTHKTIIVVTHDMDFVAENATRVLVINEGKISYDGTSHKLFQNEEFLIQNSLYFPSSTKTAIVLKEEGLITFEEYPTTKKELMNIILGGNSHE